jgi:geranylgeranyl diphosphate synthase, type I
VTLQGAQPDALGATRLLVQPAIERAVREYCPFMEPVVGYHAGWLDLDGRPANAASGKAVRPALVLLAAQAKGGPPEPAVPAAVAVELVHDFSLLHDDVMDGDTLRRNRPAAWTAFGTAPAILAGDALIVAAFQVLGEVPFADRAAAASILATTVQRLIHGQVRDLEFEARGDVSLADAVWMAGEKTAALFGCSCSLGALAGGSSGPALAALTAVAEQLGLAFQLVDDLLGIWGDATTGKPTLAGLRRRKKSLPVVAALRSQSAAGRRLGELYASPSALSDSDLLAAASLVEEAGGREWAQREAAARLTNAARSLRGLGLPEATAAAFLDLVDFLERRAS